MKDLYYFGANGTAGDNETYSGLSLSETALFVDYIYLDTDERRRFAQVSHEYLNRNWVEKQPGCRNVEIPAVTNMLVASTVPFYSPQLLVAVC